MKKLLLIPALFPMATCYGIDSTTTPGYEGWEFDNYYNMQPEAMSYCLYSSSPAKNLNALNRILPSELDASHYVERRDFVYRDRYDSNGSYDAREDNHSSAGIFKADFSLKIDQLGDGNIFAIRTDADSQ